LSPLSVPAVCAAEIPGAGGKLFETEIPPSSAKHNYVSGNDCLKENLCQNTVTVLARV